MTTANLMRDLMRDLKFQTSCKNESLNDGDLFRHWLFLDNRGNVGHRFQRLSGGNALGVNAEQVTTDYERGGTWCRPWNGTNALPLPAIRIEGGEAIELSLDETLAAIRNA